MPRKNGGSGPRCVALVGPFGSGKTTLLEIIISVTGAIQRKGSVPAGNTVGDSSPEARARQMSVETNCATTRYLDETFTILDCPGSIEFLQETLNVLPGIDAAIVVCEPEAGKAAMLQPYLKRLADLGIPHALFVNKIDKATGALRDLLAILQNVAPKPLVIRQIPIWNNGIATGFVDLALERAYVYREHAASELVDMNNEIKARETEARFQMLEKLADYDEHLMEELLSDIPPQRDEIFQDLERDLQQGLIVPVFIGSALGDHGIRRLLKMLRHEVPDVSAVRARAGVTGNDTILHVLKTYHTPHGGKLSLVRVLSGHVKDGAVLYRQGGADTRVGGLFALRGEAQIKLTDSGPGDTVALGRLEEVVTGETLSGAKSGAKLKIKSETLTPVYGLAIAAEDRISGGLVPRNFIPSVEKGIVDFLKHGPLGFPVVDIPVALTDGSYHTVDSSDAAFQTAVRIGMTEGMPNCAPVLLEPIMHVKIHVPSDSTASVNGVISTRRGRILGFDSRAGWLGWDTVEAEIPQSELHDLIVELRSLTQGVGTFEMKFDHLAELSGKLAETVVAARKAAA